MTNLLRTGSTVTRTGHHLPPLVGIVVSTALLVLLPMEWGRAGLLVAIGVIQLGLAMSWAPATGQQGYRGSIIVGLVVAVAADTVLTNSKALGLGPLAAVIALVVVAAFVHQILRNPPRAGLTESVAGVAMIGVVMVALSAYIVVWRTTDGHLLIGAATLATGAGLATSHVIDLLMPYPRFTEGLPRGLTGFLLGIIAAAAVSVWRLGGASLVDNLGAVMFGGVVGAVALLLSVAASYVAVDRGRRSLGLIWLQAALPFAAAAPVAYFLSLVVSA